MNTFPKSAPWISKGIILLSAAVFFLISVQPLIHPAASAASQGIAFTSPVGATIFRVAFAGIPLGCAAFLAYCLMSQRRSLTGLIFSALVLAFALAVRIYGMEVDASVAESMPLVIAETVLLTLTLAGIAIERKHRSKADRTAPIASAESLRMAMKG